MSLIQELTPMSDKHYEMMLNRKGYIMSGEDDWVGTFAPKKKKRLPERNSKTNDKLKTRIFAVIKGKGPIGIMELSKSVKTNFYTTKFNVNKMVESGDVKFHDCDKLYWIGSVYPNNNSQKKQIDIARDYAIEHQQFTTKRFCKDTGCERFPLSKLNRSGFIKSIGFGHWVINT